VRVRQYAVGAALSCLAGFAVPATWAADPDPDGTISQEQVDDARAAVDETAADVESVRAQLGVAQQRLETAQIAAAKAAEAFNGARYEAHETAEAAALAQQHAETAAADLERQRVAYAGAVTAAYEMSPQLTALGAISQADGIIEVLESTSALQNAEGALQGRFDSYHAAATLAEAADAEAEAALADARAATEKAREARDAARDSAGAAEQEAAHFAGERDRLIGRLAHLQDISVSLAESRQDQLEAAAAAAAAAAAQQEAEELAEQQQQEQEEQEEQATPTAQPTSQPTSQPTAQPTAPPTATPSSTPTATPTATPTTPPPPPPPPPAVDAAAAIAFARAQLGEPYKYGASGPGAWDCSGLTMMAWAAGGKSLPHYSVAQYQASTPITLGDLQPGDLLFWGDGGVSSIYHAAIYTGNGMMIHAPRPGKTVEEVSMYYWITPNYFARP